MAAEQTAQPLTYQGDLGTYTATLVESEPGDDIGLWTISGPRGAGPRYHSIKKRIMLLEVLAELALVQARFQRRA